MAFCWGIAFCGGRAFCWGRAFCTGIGRARGADRGTATGGPVTSGAGGRDSGIPPSGGAANASRKKLPDIGDEYAGSPIPPEPARASRDSGSDSQTSRKAMPRS